MSTRLFTPIGVDVGSRGIRAAQLARTPSGWRLHAAAEFARAPDSPLDAEARRLAGVLERRGFRGHNVVLAAPGEQLLGTVLELPPRSSSAPIHQLAAAELGRMHRVDPAAMEVALWEIPAANRAATGCDYMIAACPHAAANALLDSFENAGLRVRALDLPQLALLRACAGSIRPAPSMDAVLHVGWDRCSLFIVADGVIAYERTLEGAEGKALVGGITQRLETEASAVEELLTSESRGVELGEASSAMAAELRDFTTVHITALVDQLNTSFSYISRRYTDRDLGSVMMTGEYAALDGLATRVASLGVEAAVVRAGDLVKGTPSKPGACSHGPSIVAAIGLALHQEGLAA